MRINEIHNLNHAQSFEVGHAARQRVEEEIQGFEELIQEKTGDRLDLSKHAARRLGEGDIAIDSQLLGDLEYAVDETRKGGPRDAAVTGSQGMFIVNILNNIVVTAMSRNDTKNRIPTNVNGTVFMQAGPDGGPASCLKRAGRNSRKEGVC